MQSGIPAYELAACNKCARSHFEEPIRSPVITNIFIGNRSVASVANKVLQSMLQIGTLKAPRVSFAMIEVVGQILSVHEALSLPAQNAMIDSPERPTESQAAEFARATDSSPVSEVAAAPAPHASKVAASFIHQLESAASDMKGLKVSGERSETIVAPEHQPPHRESALDWSDAALARLDQAFEFAVKTSIVSHSASDATKTLNALLRGE
jgi:hypothetical protein